MTHRTTRQACQSGHRLARRRSAILVAGIAVLSLITVACGSSGKDGSGSSDPYKLGFTSDLSSQFGYIGQGMRSGAEAYFTALNNSGGINGHKVELEVLDDTNQPTQGVGNMTKLVTQDQVSAVIGFQSSGVSAAVAPLAAQYKVPMIANTVAAALVEPVQPYLFASTLHTANYSAAQMAMAKQLMDKTPPPSGAKVKVASITSSSSAALQQWSDAVKAMSEKLGWDMVDQEIVPQDGIDMSSGLTKIIAAKPDVLLMAIGADPWIVAGMKQLAGTTFPIVSYDSPSWATVQSIASDRLYYVSALSYATEAATPAFYKDAKAANLDPNGTYVIRGYYEAMIVSEGLRQCGFPCSGEQLQKALDKLDTPTGGVIQGNATFDPSNHQGVREMAAYQWNTAASAPTVVATELPPGTTLG